MISANDFFLLTGRALFILLGVLTLVDFLRRRGPVRFDIALMFGTLAITSTIDIVELIIELPHRVSVLSPIGVMAQPYLLLRLADQFYIIKRWVKSTALACLFLSAMIFFVIPPPLPIPFTLPMLAFFVIFESYVAFIFVQGALTTRGVTYWRLRLAALGSILLAAVFIFAAIRALLPESAELAYDAISLLMLILAFLAPINYYMGFAPPRQLRLIWQQAELQRFFRKLTQLGESRTKQINLLMSESAVRTVGGLSAHVAYWNNQTQQLIKHEANGAKSVIAIEGKIEEAWQSKRPFIASIKPELASPFAAPPEAKALIIIPITTNKQMWGLLFVFLRQPSLFIQDDFKLLSLMAEQSAFLLEYESLLAELKQAHEELEQRVEERTAELQYANAELEQFAYVVSHDLRAPLRAMRNYALFLEEDCSAELDEFCQEYVDGISESAEHMDNLVVDLLKYSRIGRIKVELSEVNMGELCQRVITQLALDQLAEIHLPDNLPTVLAREVRLEQILSNLLTNAIKFKRPNVNPVVTISWQEKEDAFYFSVQDNGIGISEKQFSKIFGIFQRLHTTDEYEGTGVGLAIVKKAVEEHGGQVSLQSEVGQGTTFTFSLPKP